MLAVVLGACPVGIPAAESASEILDALRSAGTLRAERTIAEQRWVEERQRLEAALALARQEATDAEQARDQVEAETGALRQEAAIAARASAAEPVRQALAEAAERLGHRLADLERTAMPGAVVVPATTGGATTDVDPFAALVRAVEESERLAREVALTTVEGDLSGIPRVVRALRVGGASAWWLALDGTSGGTVERRDGRTVLTPVVGPDVLAAIAQAMAILDGRAAPALVALPFDGAAVEGRP